MRRKHTVDLDLNAAWHTQPHLASAPYSCHFRISNTGRKAAYSAVSRCVGVCYKYDITWFGIAQFRYQLMNDTACCMEMADAVFFYQLISSFQASWISLQTCRHQVIVHDHDLICVPHFGKTHFLHFITKEGCVNIMDHNAVRLNYHQITWFYIFAANMLHNDLFS